MAGLYSESTKHVGSRAGAAIPLELGGGYGNGNCEREGR